MSNLDTVIDYTKLFQDVELSTALQQLRNNPTQLQQFLQNQQDNVYKDIVKQKSDSFQKVYGDLQRALEANEAVLMYNKRSQEIDRLYTELYDEAKKNVNNIEFDKNLASRKYEMNQWSVGNKSDTLFVYSMLFIALSIALLFGGLWRAGIIGTGFLATILAGVIIIFVLTLIYRARYTDVLRNKRYWDRKIFKGEGGKIPIPNICPGSLSGLETDLSNIQGNIESDITTSLQEATTAVSNIGTDTSNLANRINVDLTQQNF